MHDMGIYKIQYDPASKKWYLDEQLGSRFLTFSSIKELIDYIENDLKSTLNLEVIE